MYVINVFYCVDVIVNFCYKFSVSMILDNEYVEIRWGSYVVFKECGVCIYIWYSLCYELVIWVVFWKLVFVI